MTHEFYLQFMALRKQNLIGRIWNVPGGFRVAPLDCVPGLEHQEAEFMPELAFTQLVERLSGVPEIEITRKPIQRETSPAYYRRVYRKAV